MDRCTKTGWRRILSYQLWLRSQNTITTHPLPFNPSTTRGTSFSHPHIAMHTFLTSLSLHHSLDTPRAHVFVGIQTCTANHLTTRHLLNKNTHSPLTSPHLAPFSTPTAAANKKRNLSGRLSLHCQQTHTLHCTVSSETLGRGATQLCPTSLR